MVATKRREKKSDSDGNTPTSGSNGKSRHSIDRWRWVRRHPILAACGSITVGLVLVWSVVSVIQAMPKRIKVLPLERVPVADMTLDRFLAEFSTAKPVILTDAWRKDGWRPAELVANCEHANIRTFKHERGNTNWANNVQVGVSPLKEYFHDFFETPAADRTDPILYGFEMELTKHCPKQLEKVLIPQFFAEDAFHMITNRTGLGWPSILMGPQGSVTGLHIDTHQLPFWIAVVAPEGSDGKSLKRFRVFPPGDHNLLKYGTTNEKSNYHFSFDPWEPNYKSHPDVAESFVYEAEMRSGDMLYIPGGSPHAVKNLADNVGVSANFLDLKTLPHFVRKCNQKSPLCGLLAGKGAWIIDALEKIRALGKSVTYYEFAGIKDKSDFCEVHAQPNVLDAKKAEPRPAVDEYCQ